MSYVQLCRIDHLWNGIKQVFEPGSVFAQCLSSFWRNNLQRRVALIAACIVLLTSCMYAQDFVAWWRLNSLLRKVGVDKYAPAAYVMRPNQIATILNAYSSGGLARASFLKYARDGLGRSDVRGDVAGQLVFVVLSEHVSALDIWNCVIDAWPGTDETGSADLIRMVHKLIVLNSVAPDRSVVSALKSKCSSVIADYRNRGWTPRPISSCGEVDVQVLCNEIIDKLE